MFDSKTYKQHIRPLLFKLDSEAAHALAKEIACLAGPFFSAFSSELTYQENDLELDLTGIKLKNPVGLAAGFDKNAHLVSVLGKIGFGFAEVGSITGQASPGNPRPRLFRLVEDEALINRMGLNGDGAQVIAKRLKSNHFSLPIGVNIAKTNDPAIVGDAAVQDILKSFAAIKNLAIQYVTVNASCPNTKEGIIKEKEQLATILFEIQKLNDNRLPLFVKLSPDSSDELLDDMIEVATDNKLSGYVCGNTSQTREHLKTSASAIQQIGNGGLSGRPIKQLGLNLTRRIALRKSSKQAIIGVGGIFNGQDAFDYITSGASAIQIYTGLIYEGPSLPKQICRELSQILSAKQLSLSDAVGLNVLSGQR